MRLQDPTEAEKTNQAHSIMVWLNSPEYAGWSFEPVENHYSRHIKHEAGYGVSLRWERGRIEITGQWPMDAEKRLCIPNEGYRPVITVDLAKPAIKIAQDISKRFMPGYLAVWSIQKAKADAQNTYDELTRVNIARIVDASEGLARTSVNSKHGVYFHHSHLYSTTVQGDSVRIEAFNMPIDQFLAILPHMKDQTRATPINEAYEAASVDALAFDEGAEGEHAARALGEE